MFQFDRYNCTINLVAFLDVAQSWGRCSLPPLSSIVLLWSKMGIVTGINSGQCAKNHTAPMLAT